MKVLCVIPSYWPAFQLGGPIFSVHQLNKTLALNGIDVTVYTTNDRLENDPNIGRRADVDKVKINYFSYSRFLHFLGSTGWHFSLEMTRALRDQVKNFDLVYIVAIWNYPTAIAAYYCRKYKKPYIVSPRGLLYPYAVKKKLYKKWLYYNLISKKDLMCASAIHYTSEDEKEACHSFLGLKNRAFVIPNGINLAEFDKLPDAEVFRQRYALAKGNKIILFLGRINWKKGLDLLIDAYGRLLKERNDIYLVVAGNDEGGYLKKVEGWVKGFGVKGKVIFTGMLTGKNKLEAYAACDMFVLPSYSENFGMAAVEAMACVKPVIVSNNVGICREIKANNAGLVVECNANGICAALKSLLENPNLAKDLSLNAKSMVAKNYNIDDIAQRMLEAFEQVVVN